jgi:predicted transposase/invertase (TIGR01784 family)
VLEIHFIELAKFRRESQDLKNPLHRWLMFLEDVSPDLLEVLKMEDPAIAKAESVLEWLSCDQETLRLYELREKALHDEVTRFEGALEKGRAEGEAKGKLEVAMNLLAEGLEVPLVVKTTGLPEAEVRRLIEKNARSRPSE